jgi:hypothetical protein
MRRHYLSVIKEIQLDWANHVRDENNALSDVDLLAKRGRERMLISE